MRRNHYTNRKYNLVKADYGLKVIPDVVGDLHPGYIVYEQVVVRVYREETYHDGYGDCPVLYAKDQAGNLYTCHVNCIDYWGGANHWLRLGTADVKDRFERYSNTRKYVTPEKELFVFTATWVEQPELPRVSWSAE